MLLFTKLLVISYEIQTFSKDINRNQLLYQLFVSQIYFPLNPHSFTNTNISMSFWRGQSDEPLGKGDRSYSVSMVNRTSLPFPMVHSLIQNTSSKHTHSFSNALPSLLFQVTYVSHKRRYTFGNLYD